MIYTDFSKARIDHEKLLFKLSRIGLDRIFIIWISSYRRNRTQYVLLKDIVLKYYLFSLEFHKDLILDLNFLMCTLMIFWIKHNLQNAYLYKQVIWKFLWKIVCYQRLLKFTDSNVILSWCDNNRLDLNIKNYERNMS